MNRMLSDTQWIQKMAQKEANGFISVGGLVADLREEAAGPAIQQVARYALGRLISLWRRERGLSTEQFAERSKIDVADLLSIERAEQVFPEPRTISQLAHVLECSTASLMQLSGLAQPRDARFREAAIRFAARSEPIEKLSPSEHEALEEFVKFLAER